MIHLHAPVEADVRIRIRSSLALVAALQLSGIPTETSAVDVFEVQGTAIVTLDATSATPIQDGDGVRVRVEYDETAPLVAGDGICNAFSSPLDIELEVPDAGIDLKATRGSGGIGGIAQVCDDRPGDVEPGSVDSVRWELAGSSGQIGGQSIGSLVLMVSEALPSSGPDPDLVPDSLGVPRVAELDFSSPDPEQLVFSAGYTAIDIGDPLDPTDDQFAVVAFRMENPMLVPEAGSSGALAIGATVLECLSLARRRTP